MDGDGVLTSERAAMSYTPVERKSYSTLLLLLAQMRRPMGTPMSRAYQAARMLPKLPVGTQTSMHSPSATTPRAARSA